MGSRGAAKATPKRTSWTKFIDILGQGVYSLGGMRTEEKTRIF